MSLVKFRMSRALCMNDERASDVGKLPLCMYRYLRLFPQPRGSACSQTYFDLVIYSRDLTQCCPIKSYDLTSILLGAIGCIRRAAIMRAIAPRAVLKDEPACQGTPSDVCWAVRPSFRSETAPCLLRSLLRSNNHSRVFYSHAFNL